MNLYSENSVAGALQRNTCPLCGHHYMAGDRIECRTSEGIKIKYTIGCFVCMNRWEVQEITFNNVVRICDTKSWKERNGWQHLPLEVKA